MYVPHGRKLCLRGRFPWLLVSPATAKSRHVVGRESSTFFLSLASEVQERYLSLRFRSQTKKKQRRLDPAPGLRCWSRVENELHSTWLDLDEKRSFLERFKYHVPAFGLKEDARTSNTSFESYALDLSQGILR